MLIIFLATVWLKLIELLFRISAGWSSEWIIWFLIGAALSISLGTVVFGFIFSERYSEYIWLAPMLWYFFKDIINVFRGVLSFDAWTLVLIPIEAVAFALPIGIASYYIIDKWVK